MLYIVRVFFFIIHILSEFVVARVESDAFQFLTFNMNRHELCNCVWLKVLAIKFILTKHWVHS